MDGFFNNKSANKLLATLKKGLSIMYFVNVLRYPKKKKIWQSLRQANVQFIFSILRLVLIMNEIVLTADVSFMMPQWKWS